MKKDILKQLEELSKRDIHNEAWFEHGQKTLQSHMTAHPAPPVSTVTPITSSVMTIAKFAIPILLVAIIGVGLATRDSDPSGIDDLIVPISSDIVDPASTQPTISETPSITEPAVTSTPVPKPQPTPEPQPTHTPAPEPEKDLTLSGYHQIHSISLQWTGYQGANFDSYKLIRSRTMSGITYGGAGDVIASIEDPSILSYTDENIVPSAKYYYRVCAVSKSGGTQDVVCSNVHSVQSSSTN